MNYALNPAVATFLLAGGASSRMGRDKALLPFRSKPLVVYLSEILSSFSDEFHIIAPPGRYEAFGFPILHDLRPNCGPLAGIEAALTHSTRPWNLILACDLPHIDPTWLDTLCQATKSSAAEVILSDPLCALWHKSTLSTVRQALDSQKFRVRSVLEQLKTQILIPPDPGILANWNRPEDLSVHPDEGKANRGG